MISFIMMSIGTGVYEVWGTPYDFVHEMNKTEAYDDSIPDTEAKMLEIDSDFVGSEAQAQAFAIRELIYESFSGMTYNLILVDDLSIEKGDILQLPDGSRTYVLGYSRTMERGKAHMLNVSGFRV
jgi:hypothetical protein